MNKILVTPVFKRNLKVIGKKYPAFYQDIADLIESLENNPYQGVEYMPNVRKIRLAITGKNKGKSGGSRVVTYTVEITENGCIIYLLCVYDKAQIDSISDEEVLSIIQGLAEDEDNSSST